MIREDEALQKILDRVAPGPSVTRPLVAACGRFAREAVVARIPLPPFDNSAMDGYAISDADCGQTGRWLTVEGEQPAGQPSRTRVTPGHATRVFTGAPLPAGTAAIVMQEDVETNADGQSIRLTAPAAAGEFIRRRGADVCAGQRLIESGERLSPQMIALLASQGLEQIAVGELPRISVLTTGDEIHDAGEPLPDDASLYNSNGPMLEALCRNAGCVDVTRAHARDQLDDVSEAIFSAFKSSDVLILAGGVSVGGRDFVKPALARVGCEVSLWRVLIKPGKPFLFASRADKLVFGLPGNPVSAFVTFGVLVAPALKRWQGASTENSLPPFLWTKLGQPLENQGDRPHYLRGTINSAGEFFLSGLQESHAIFTLSRANALVRLAPHAALAAGQFAPALSLRPLL
jgi:molybdopterin molybdotransferase